MNDELARIVIAPEEAYFLCTMPAFACGREKPRDTFLWKARGKVEI
jgi:hypothetical protein